MVYNERRKIIKRIVSLLLVLLLCGMLPVNVFAAETDGEMLIHSYESDTCTDYSEEEPAAPIALRYDDHVDLSGKTVEVIDASSAKSYQVGYGVAENAVPDTAVIALDGSALVAVGTGTAKLKIVTQPTDGEALLGGRYCATVQAEGEGLTYQWYGRNAGSRSWFKSSVRDNTYDDVMNKT
ncbi:MAG: hypothetical protein IJ412_05775, partial [Oscillospiraceae bacterium]|nr:hypothetical protein [Oscillospiraceae bacterium]